MNLSQLRFHIMAIASVMIVCSRLVNMAVYGAVNLHWLLIVTLMSMSIASSIYLGMLIGIAAVLVVGAMLHRANEYISVLMETRRRIMRNSGLSGY